jgi:DNA-binding protein HU-beta
MIKKDLVNAVAEKCEITKINAAKVVDSVIEVISEALGNKETVKLAGFATFSVVKRAAKNCSNPKTKEIMTIPETDRIKVTFGQPLKDKVNGK